jgi:hypothetical protein
MLNFVEMLYKGKKFIWKDNSSNNKFYNPSLNKDQTFNKNTEKERNL